MINLGLWWFQCKKCSHRVFTDKIKKVLKELPKTDCPECGEEGEENWIVLGLK